jgi:hypothetical protein
VNAAVAPQEVVLVSLAALLETKWMLRSRYHTARAILGLFRAALETPEPAFEDEVGLEWNSRGRDD